MRAAAEPGLCSVPAWFVRLVCLFGDLDLPHITLPRPGSRDREEELASPGQTGSVSTESSSEACKTAPPLANCGSVKIRTGRRDPPLQGALVWLTTPQPAWQARAPVCILCRFGCGPRHTRRKSRTR